MKRILTIGVALMLSTSVFAIGPNQNPVFAGAGGDASTNTSGYASGGASANGNSGPNFAFQGSSSTATNTTSVSASRNGSRHSSRVGASVNSIGDTTSASWGEKAGRAYGSTDTHASQYGSGNASASGRASDRSHRLTRGSGSTNVNAYASQGSETHTSNVNNGTASAVSGGFAVADTNASLHIDANHSSVEAEQSSNTFVEAGGYADSVKTGRGRARADGDGDSGGNASTYVIMSDGTYRYDD